MTILADLLDQILEQDPHASAEYFLVARQYIQTQWQALHGTPMPVEALTLYMADPSRSDLTEEQKALAHRCLGEVRGSFQRTIWNVMLCDQMLKDDIIRNPREFRNLNRRRYAGGGAPETRCEPLCAPGQDNPIPAHQKYIPKACDGAVRESGTVFCDSPLPPRIPPCLGPFRPAEFGTR